MSDEIINQLTERIQRLKDGYEGCCTACEPVGEMNQKLRQEVEQLRKERDEVEPLLNELWERRTEATEMREEITRLRTERDEARRRICEMLHEEGYGRSPDEWAERKGWDCFKEDK